MQAHDGLASLALADADYESAANWALSALDSDMHAWRAHYHLGIALAMLGKAAEAIAAFEASKRINPKCAAPYYWMARVARSQLADPQQANHYRSLGLQLLRERRERRTATAGTDPGSGRVTPPVT